MIEACGLAVSEFFEVGEDFGGGNVVLNGEVTRVCWWGVCGEVVSTRAETGG